MSEKAEARLTANDRFKRSFGTWFWGSMILATVLHFVVFAAWPEMTAEDVSVVVAQLEAIELPPEIEIPPPPEAIARPATPVITTAQIDEDITIAPTTFEDNPVEDLPPPPEEVTTTDIAAAPTFTPYTVRPDIKNRDEVARALEREYPPLLRDAGIGGTVQVWFFIDEEGRVQNTQVNESSGHKALDDAAIKVAEIIEFTPALNRDKRVPVWISLPVTFTTR
ncbi:MAG: energy transducer TonB [Gemmatimonadota bacterium]|jgi:protein TonB